MATFAGTVEGITAMRNKVVIYKQDAIDAVADGLKRVFVENRDVAEILLKSVPSAQPDIKQAAKLLSDFIESCPGGDSYLITPNGEELRTDWGYAMEGIQLIHDWAERRTDV